MYLRVAWSSDIKYKPGSGLISKGYLEIFFSFLFENIDDISLISAPHQIPIVQRTEFSLIYAPVLKRGLLNVIALEKNGCKYFVDWKHWRKNLEHVFVISMMIIIILKYWIINKQYLFRSNKSILTTPLNYRFISLNPSFKNFKSYSWNYVCMENGLFRALSSDLVRINSIRVILLGLQSAGALRDKWPL